MNQTIHISFNKEPAVFQPGESIVGTVTVHNRSRVSIRGVKMSLSGRSYVEWNETEKNSEGNDDVRTYSDGDTYYQMEFWAFGTGNSQDLEPGIYNFPFTFVLPQNNIPGSFECEFGYIRHQCAAKLDLPWKSDLKCIRCYCVSPVLDLNQIESATAAIRESEDKTLCCLCCASGPISFVLCIDHSGFVCGEPMIINAECSNKSNRYISRIDAILEQKVTLKANGKEKDIIEAIRTLERGEIPPGGDQIWSGENLIIPIVPPSSKGVSKQIDVEYRLKFTMHPKGPAWALSKHIPITIGTIPLREVIDSYYRPSSIELPSYPGKEAPIGFENPLPSATEVNQHAIPHYAETEVKTKRLPGDIPSVVFDPVYPNYKF